MNTTKYLCTSALSGLMLMAVGACSAPMDSETTATEATATDEAAIISGTAINLGANSFLRLPAAGCTATLLTNVWAITANHCATTVGDSVYMDSQARAITRVVPHPDAIYGIDIKLIKLSGPMYVNGTTTGFTRALRPTVAPSGTHIRCFGYGQTFNGTGITSQLRYMSLNTAGGGNNAYYFLRNSLNQSAAAGDAGGACLDDMGSALAVMLTFSSTPSTPGETAAVTSQYYANWAQGIVNTCDTNADCSTNVCNVGQHRCVINTCFDGVQDNDETGLDCGGSCIACQPEEPECKLPRILCGNRCVLPRLCRDEF